MVINLIWIKRKDCISHLVRVWSVATLVWVKTSEHNSSEPVPCPNTWPRWPLFSLYTSIFLQSCGCYIYRHRPLTRPDLSYPSSSFRRRQKGQCDQWKEPSFQCLHKVTTKYFQPLAITRTHSTWNILTSKHLLQSFQGEDYTLHKPEAIDIADGFCQNTVSSGTSREFRATVTCS